MASEFSETYTLNGNTLKAGSLIKFTGDTTSYRVLSGNVDGTAEIFPVTNLYPGNEWGEDHFSMYGAKQLITTYYTRTNQLMQCNAAPLEANGCLTAGDNGSNEHAPFAAYLQNTTVSPQTFGTDSYENTKSSHPNTPDFTLRTSNGNKNYYTVDVAVNNGSNNHKWRPLTIEDLVNYFDTYVDIDEVNNFLKLDNMGFGNNIPNVPGTTGGLNGGGYRDSGITETGIYMFPVFKLNLLACKDIGTLLQE